MSGPSGTDAPTLRRRLLIAWFRFSGWVTSVMLAISFLFALSILAVVTYEHVYDYHSHAVLSGSMSPQLPIGSLVITKSVPSSQIRIGDIITFSPPGHSDIPITHRIDGEVTELPPPSGTGQRYFLTRGDANPIRDSWRIPVQGNFERAENMIPYAGYIAVWLQSRWARWVLLLGPAVLLAIIFMIEIWQPRRSRS